MWECQWQAYSLAQSTCNAGLDAQLGAQLHIVDLLWYSIILCAESLHNLLQILSPLKVSFSNEMEHDQDFIVDAEHSEVSISEWDWWMR